VRELVDETRKKMVEGRAQGQKISDTKTKEREAQPYGR